MGEGEAEEELRGGEEEEEAAEGGVQAAPGRAQASVLLWAPEVGGGLRGRGGEGRGGEEGTSG